MSADDLEDQVRRKEHRGCLGGKAWFPRILRINTQDRRGFRWIWKEVDDAIEEGSLNTDVSKGGTAEGRGSTSVLEGPRDEGLR